MSQLNVKCILWAFICSMLICITAVKAHESRPVHVLIESKSDHFDIRIMVPYSVAPANLPIITLGNFIDNQNIDWITTNSGYKQSWQVDNIGQSLKGKTFLINYPLFNPVLSTIISIQAEGHDDQILILPPERESMLLPNDLSAWYVIWRYTRLGIDHIWAGIDHLLFVICLLFVTASTRKIWLTVTGFTLAHSATLVLSALDLLRLPIAPIEASIALSIVFLCYEIIHHHSEKLSLTYRYPVLVSSSFGLLHGLGFAAVLNEIGLPDAHKVKALFFFNIGVEIGQILFIVFVLSLVFFLRSFFKRFKWSISQVLETYALKVVIYSVGITASYWMFDRIL